MRPQEAVAAIQAFARRTPTSLAAVADYNRAQFRLYRALGHPAQCLGRVRTASYAGAVVGPRAGARSETTGATFAASERSTSGDTRGGSAEGDTGECDAARDSAAADNQARVGVGVDTRNAIREPPADRD